MRTAAKRDANERAIIDTLKANGCYVESVSGPGLADTLVHRKGVLYRAEVKGAKRGLTERQVLNFAKAHRACVATFILRTPRHAEMMLQGALRAWHPSDGACAPAVTQRKHRPGYSKARTLGEMCAAAGCVISRRRVGPFCTEHTGRAP
jgi:hypothetical protein